MTAIWTRVSKRIESYKEEIVQFQAKLVACPALGPENGGQGEWEKTELLADLIETLGPESIDWVNAPDVRVSRGSRPNLLAFFPGERRGRVWVLAHTDVVPPGEVSLWAGDPFTLRQEGDVIYGRGVEDNHHGLTAAWFALKAILDEGLRPALDVGLALVADEETGSSYGLNYILNHRPDLFSPEDLIIVPDFGDEHGAMIEVTEKSILWTKFIVTGRQCHGSTPDRGINTLRAAARMILALDEGLPVAFAAVDPLFSIPISTFEPTKKEANVPNINTIPGEDVFYFDARVLPGYELDQVKAEMRRLAEVSAASSGVTVRLEFAQEVQAPPATSTETPVVKALSRAVAEVLKQEARPTGIGGGTVAAFFRKKGLPAAVWITSLGQAHAPNEYTTVSAIIKDAQVMAHVFLGR